MTEKQKMPPGPETSFLIGAVGFAKSVVMHPPLFFILIPHPLPPEWLALGLPIFIYPIGIFFFSSFVFSIQFVKIMEFKAPLHQLYHYLVPIFIIS